MKTAPVSICGAAFCSSRRGVPAGVQIALYVLTAACGTDTSSQETGPWGPVQVDVLAEPPASLSELNLLRFDGESVQYNEGLIPYRLNTELFSDYALKQRAIYVPPREAVQYHPSETFRFPVGSAIVKSFLFAPDMRASTEQLQIIETRLLLRAPQGWKAYPYIWHDDGSDAQLRPAGDVRSISFIDAKGDPRTASYLIPQRNQCFSCHEIKDEQAERRVALLGPKARHLNVDGADSSAGEGQLQQWRRLGVLDGLPKDSEVVPRAYDFTRYGIAGIESWDRTRLSEAARDYLDINCAHCHHRRAVQGISSQLFLDASESSSFHLGICKRPGSAGTGNGGLSFDIVPGDADASILMFRLETEIPGAMMPLLGRSLAHTEGVALIRAWINSMPAQSCQ